MKKTIIAVAVSLVAFGAFAQNSPELNSPHKFPARGYAKPGGSSTQNLVYHTGGKVLRNAHVVLIFWGPSFAANGVDAGYVTSITNFRNQFGTNREFNTITQYTGIDDNDGSSGAINLSTLGPNAASPDWVDTSTPPTNVTDATVQSEVKKYLGSHATDYAAVYEVFIPSSSYSSDGTSTSCGGPNLAYCAYHSHYVDGAGRNVKYSIQPWAGCSGCSSFSDTTLDQEHFVCHETREAVTDALGNAWYDRQGSEADDKCAWSPAPFTDGGFGYQYEWSNANNGCISWK